MFCVPRIILTECPHNPPSIPEASFEEPDPRKTPTPRPRTLAVSRRAWNCPQALPGQAAEAPQSSSSLVMEKEGSAQKSLAIGGCSLEDTGARVSRPPGPSMAETQKPASVETHSEETSKDSGWDDQTCSGEHPVANPGYAKQSVTPQRMDSLEETLRELEATLSEMGTAPTMGHPGSPPPLPLSPQVAAFPQSSPAFLLQSLGLQCGGSGSFWRTMPALLPSLSSPPPESLLSGQGLWQSLSRLGSQPAQDSAFPASARSRRGLSLLCIFKVNK